MDASLKLDRRRVVDFISENGFYVIFLLWVLFLALQTDTFMTWDNASKVVRQAAIIGIVAIGESLIVMLGTMDVSVASTLGLTAIIVAAGIVDFSLPPALAVLIAIGAGGLIGLVNGLLVTLIGINPIIATLGMMTILDGLGLTYTGGHTIYGDAIDPIEFLYTGWIGPVPVPVLLLFVFYLVAHFVLSYTTFGAYIYATGSNDKATWLSGIKTARIRLYAFVIAGLLAGFGGVMAAARRGSAGAGMGGNFLFPILTAVILGGISLSGGRGRVLNVLAAAIFLMAIDNGLIHLGADINIQRIVSGAILIVALSLDRLRVMVR
ncbi:MAG: ABC transporter permease [Anaerolineae bacterium]